MKRTIELTMKSGIVTIDIEINHKVIDKTVDLDGDIINAGKETFDTLDIIAYKAGKKVSHSACSPTILSESVRKMYKLPAEAYAMLDKVVLTLDNYNLVMDAIAAVTAEVIEAETAEYKATKAIEEAKEAAKYNNILAAEESYQKAIENGLCPKCHSYCYGDCGN